MKIFLSVSLYILMGFFLFYKAALGMEKDRGINKSIYISLAPPQETPGISQKQSVVSYSSTFPAPKLIPQLNSFVKVEMEGLNSWPGKTGAPLLPAKPLQLLIPYGYRPLGVKISYGKIKEIGGKYLVLPEAEVRPISAGTYKPPMDENIYRAQGPYPEIPCSALLMQKKRGYNVLYLNLFPVVYYPAGQRIAYFETLTVEVDATYVGPPGENEIKPAQDKETQDEIRNSVNNPEALQSYIK